MENNREIIFKDTNLVSKANSIVEATYKLGVMEQKIISVIASNIHPNDKDFQTYTFSIKQFGDLIGSKSKNLYKEVDKITTQLMQPFLFINHEGKPTRIAWLSKATYNINEGSVTVRFDPDLKPFFLLLNQKFTRYKLGNILHLRSNYSIRLYELLKSYEGLTERTFTLEELRAKLGLQDKYPVWINFRQRVIDHAQAELAKKTDISFTYDAIRKGRSIHKIKFKIKTNSSSDQIIKIEEDTYSQDVIDIQRLGLEIGMNLNKKVITEWLNYGKNNIVELMQSIKYDDTIKNPIGYISAVLPKKATTDEQLALFEDDKSILIEKAIREFIMSKLPKRKVTRIEKIPHYMHRNDALEILKKYFDEEESKRIWEEQGAEITEKLYEESQSKLIKAPSL
ncbi:replication initiation protein (plasmid) [Niallia taxi]|uniref:replication initiation protein n=1 Tax=Niallia taxi TaxID=2499688 RepID=UPI002E1D30C3|nr:replication initiation protein [Niallia taxi]MED4121676.1 replication initiation protein [Niallia taxi]